MAANCSRDRSTRCSLPDRGDPRDKGGNCSIPRLDRRAPASRRTQNHSQVPRAISLRATTQLQMALQARVGRSHGSAAFLEHQSANQDPCHPSLKCKSFTTIRCRSPQEIGRSGLTLPHCHDSISLPLNRHRDRERARDDRPPSPPPELPNLLETLPEPHTSCARTATTGSWPPTRAHRAKAGPSAEIVGAHLLEVSTAAMRSPATRPAEPASLARSLKSGLQRERVVHPSHSAGES